jgi:soluble lytic murein transglycosylase
MNYSKKKKKLINISFYAIIGIFIFAIIFGVLYDLIAGETEKKLYPRKYSIYVSKYCKEYGVPEPIAYAVIKTESDFEKNAVSSSDPPALGLMQLTEDTYEWIALLLGEKTTAFGIYDPSTNIKYGIYLLSFLYRRYENWDTAYAAYNAGLGRVDKWLTDPNYSKDGETLYYIPFTETRNYVKKVNKSREIYEKLYYEE